MVDAYVVKLFRPSVANRADPVLLFDSYVD